MSNQDLSVFIPKQLPEYVNDQHPLFVEFLTLYFEWLMNQKNAAWTIRNISNIRDIDRTLDEFIDYFKKEYLVTIPGKLLTRPELLIKHINDFYKAKGSEKSFKFLFRILFNDTVDFYYPGRDLLRVSDGKWQENYTMFLTSVTGNISGINSRPITGNTSGAIALVETNEIFVTAFTNNYTKLVLNKSSIKGTFQIGETITATSEAGDAISGVIIASVIEPLFSNDAGGHAKGDTFTVKQGSTTIATGSYVSVIDGFINKLQLNQIVPIDTGQGSITFVDDNSISVTFTNQTTAIAKNKGFFLNNDGMPDSEKKIQDDLFWQDYSYQLKSTVPIAQYFDIVQKTLHPAGMKLFAELQSALNSINSVAFNSTVVASILKLLDIVRVSSFAQTVQQYYMLFNENDIIPNIVLAQFYYDLTLGNLAGGNSAVNDNGFFPDILSHSFGDSLSVPIPQNGGYYPPYSLLTIS